MRNFNAKFPSTVLRFLGGEDLAVTFTFLTKKLLGYRFEYALKMAQYCARFEHSIMNAVL